MKKYIVAGALVASLVSGSALPATAAVVDVPACTTAAANPTDANVVACLAALVLLPPGDQLDTFGSLPTTLQTAIANQPGSTFQTGAGPGAPQPPVPPAGPTFVDTPSSGGGGPTLTTDPTQTPAPTPTPTPTPTPPGGGTPGSRT